MARAAWALALMLSVSGCRRDYGRLANFLEASAAQDAAEDVVLQPAEPVRVPVDGWVLHGELRPRNSTTLVLLLHQLGSNRHEWDEWIRQLTEHHDRASTLAIDLRGHGESTEGPDGVTTWQSFGTERAAWAGLVRDVSATVAWAAQHLQPRPARVLVVGSSIGGSAALVAAAEDTAVQGVLALSPGLAYHGLEVRQAVRQLAARNADVLLVAAEGDSTSMEAVRALRADARRGEPLRVLLMPQSALHGVSMMRGPANALSSAWSPLTAWLTQPSSAGAEASQTLQSDGGLVLDGPRPGP